MKILRLASALALAVCSLNATAAGDPAAGQLKAGACVICHGATGYPGIFYTLQLAGRNADKLTVKTNKYRSAKILHPIMNLSVLGLTDQDVENISAYYQSLKQPILLWPGMAVQGDKD